MPDKAPVCKILTVDDQMGIDSFFYEFFSVRNYEVFNALSGKEAIEIVKKHKPRIVLLDIKMRGMDGIETLKAIKARYPLIEVIMLTGHATVESAIDGMKDGALDYLMKPCDLDVLMAKVREAKNKKAAQEAKIAEARAMSIYHRRGD